MSSLRSMAISAINLCRQEWRAWAPLTQMRSDLWPAEQEAQARCLSSRLMRAISAVKMERPRSVGDLAAKARLALADMQDTVDPDDWGLVLARDILSIAEKAP
ncbi:hypothetical protein HLH36_16975 [Gluconacetobacter aggeris]|uniref:Uncharacterized protein n=1 Tax=Gluconacetobacter aggeris TaxID=1286186 RepID=A0A7W4IVW6_9PROT|nr:hypothetical protein [Gluconacetobacter aggeris]MBB2170019.1 hypothetical protein [Gluconacetobacter aggeris]